MLKFESHDFHLSQNIILYFSTIWKSENYKYGLQDKVGLIGHSLPTTSLEQICYQEKWTFTNQNFDLLTQVFNIFYAGLAWLHHRYTLRLIPLPVKQGRCIYGLLGAFLFSHLVDWWFWITSLYWVRLYLYVICKIHLWKPFSQQAFGF